MAKNGEMSKGWLPEKSPRFKGRAGLKYQYLVAKDKKGLDSVFCRRHIQMAK